MVEEPEEQQGGADHHGDAAHHRPLHDHSLAAVGEEEHEDEDDPGAQKQDDPQRGRDHTLGAVCAVGARALAVGPLVEPLAVGGLLGGRARLDRLQRMEHGDAPRVVPLAQGACIHLRPFLVHDRARVADELTRDDLRLGHGTAARGVEALEREEDDEAEEHCEAGREHAEDAGRAVPVLEVASLGSPPADEQHRGGCGCGDQQDDQGRPEEVHRSQQARNTPTSQHRPMRVKPAAEALRKLRR